MEPDVGLFTFDPARKSVSLKQVFIPSWAHLMKYLQLLEERALAGTYPYRRVVIDGVDMMYRHCQKHVERNLRVQHVSEAQWSRGWDELKGTFTGAVDRFMAVPGGCWWISHSEWKKIKTRRGIDMEKLVPHLKPSASEIVVAKADATFAYDYNGSERVIVVRGDEQTEACCKIKHHFMTPKGRPIVEVPAGNSEEEAYSNLLSAFNNEQWFTTLNERDVALQKRAKGGQPADK